MTAPQDLIDGDLDHLRRCVALAAEALDAGDEPFGSILVDADQQVLHVERNRVTSGDATCHPEFAIARWAEANLTPEQRAEATVYTSGEHCPMCAAAHGWVGLGPIVYATSAMQLAKWLDDWQVEAPRVAALPIRSVVPGVTTRGPAPELEVEIRALYHRYFRPDQIHRP